MLFYASTSAIDGSWDERFGNSAAALQNRGNWCQKNNLTLSQLVFARQTHGSTIAVVDESNHGEYYHGSSKVTSPEGIDAMLTKTQNIFLVIVTADCLPVFFYDAVQEVVGIAHCGWKGLLAELPVHMIHTFQERFHSKPEDIRIMLGPSIRSCCYRVDQAPDGRIAQFQTKFGLDVAHNGYLNLPLVLQKQLVQAGISLGKADLQTPCTACDANLFSYYRDGENLKGQQAHIIGMRSDGTK